MPITNLLKRTLLTVRLFTFPLILFSLALSVHAQPEPGQPRGDRFAPPPNAILDSLDSNRDGVISAEEMVQAKKALLRLDKNRDGKLSADEFDPRPPGFFNFPGRGGGPGGAPGGPGPNRVEQKLTEKFDLDTNGYLDLAERTEALKEVQTRARRSPRGGREREEGTPGPKVNPADVKSFPNAELYDPKVLRTVFITFDTDQWEDQMAKFKDTDVEMPATVLVDGKKYPMVGVKFRGQSSFGHVPAGSKRSLNLSMDFMDPKQNLYGYKTINLLNCNGDASFLSSILYSHVASPYVPTPKANIMKVVINGESWGIYSNVQQFNKDFLKEFYNTRSGARWKAAGSPQADGGLRYLGEDAEPYRQRFEIKSADKEESWKSLAHLCKILNETPVENLKAAIEPILNVDGVLRFLALDVALVNSDGYWTRASDYSIYLDPNGVFHILPHDMNECFRGAGGPGGRRPRGGGRFGGFRGGPPNDGGPPQDRPEGDRRGGGPPGGRPPGGGGHGGPTLDPLVGQDNPRMPLRSKLLAVPEYRQRYLQYVRTIAEKNLTQQYLSSVITRYRKLISDEVKADTRKMTSLDAFVMTTAPAEPGQPANPASLNGFIEARREYLLNHETLQKVSAITAKPFTNTQEVTNPVNAKIDVVINEFCASNTQGHKDPQGQFDDWIELFNRGKTDVDLTGIYLSDDSSKLAKWKFPKGTRIKAGGYLLIWADEDGGDDGLHANFKLSKQGETIILSNGVQVTDKVQFPGQSDDVSQGRQPGGRGRGEFVRLKPTPGSANQPSN